MASRGSFTSIGRGVSSAVPPLVLLNFHGFVSFTTEEKLSLSFHFILSGKHDNNNNHI